MRAVVDVVASSGYPHARIGDLASTAGVSRATFYEQFENKEECFLAAHDELSERLLASTAAAVAAGPRGHAARSVVRAVTEFADREPDAFSFLTYDAMLAGPEGRDRRDRLIALLADQLKRADRSKQKGSVLDVPPWIVLGGVIRVLGIRMRGSQPVSETLAADLVLWINSYRPPAGRKRPRRRLPTARRLDVTQRVSPGPLGPQPLPRGRHRLPGAVVQRVQHERILYATARVIREKGYPSTTVADIVAAAGVSREVFYSHFRSRSEAFIETHQFIFEQMMAAIAGAFFASTGPWPEQLWNSANVATKFALDMPDFTQFAFVESYALGATVARRTDDAILAFTALLSRGYAERPELPPAISDAIVGAIVETVAFYVRRDRSEELIELLPTMAYLVIAPFMGVDAAEDFIAGKMREPAADGR
ncbi:MAG TPA: TetR/AcrR family transcriptional regulator [Solirubrobacteraceae bacterium]|nr:TetR/AcrR family transcriptional regulator [Solirubrobacteraceae bacterium]